MLLFRQELFEDRIHILYDVRLSDGPVAAGMDRLVPEMIYLNETANTEILPSPVRTVIQLRSNVSDRARSINVYGKLIRRDTSFQRGSDLSLPSPRKLA